MLKAAEPVELDRERKREQEPEQDLYAKACHAQLLNQLGQVPVVALCRRLPPGIRRGGDGLI